MSAASFRRVALRRVVALALFTLLAAALLTLLVGARSRLRSNPRDIPLSPVTAGWFVGPEFVEQAGLTTGEQVAGELDDVATLAGTQFDPGAPDPEIRRFYEQTGEYDFRYRARWHTPFRTGVTLASLFTRRIQQLNLPGPNDESWHRLESRFLDVDEPGAVTDGEVAALEQPARENVRAWVRTDPETGEAVFVALYATHHRDGEGFVNIAAPLPGGAVDTVLRPKTLDSGDGDGTGIRLTTRGPGDPGLYLRTPFGAFEVPGGQEFRVWRSAGEAANGDSELRATHEMWLFGRTFLIIEYEIRRMNSSSAGEANLAR